MDLATDAMLVSLTVSNWSARRHDSDASAYVAMHHNATNGAGRYHKRLIPKEALKGLSAVSSHARAFHYHHTLPWDSKHARLLPVTAYSTYTEGLARLQEQLLVERIAFTAEYAHHIAQARHDLGDLFNLDDYPSIEILHEKYALTYHITPVTTAEHFLAKIATSDTEKVKRDIEREVKHKLEHAIADLYKRLEEGIEHVRERLTDEPDGTPRVFRDSMIHHLRKLVDTVPQLNIFGDERLAMLCEEVKRRIANVDPEDLRPGSGRNPTIRSQVKRDADDLKTMFAGYFAAAKS